MKPKIIPSLLALLGVLVASARADTVILKDGSVIHGKALDIAGGILTITTDFAGDLSIKQNKVASFETDDQVFVKTDNNSTLLGKVDQRPSGLIVASENGSYTTKIETIKSSWPQGAEDPEVAALRHHWVIELTTDITGKSGNSTGFGGAAGAVASLTGPTDTLKFYGSASHVVADGQTSEDTYKGGVEYNAFFSERLSWYASTELMQDNVKDIALRASALGGIGYNAIRSAKQDLQFRAGLSYRYETYDTPQEYDAENNPLPGPPNFSSAGLNLALSHRLDVGTWGVMKNSISYVPSFQDINNYVIDHDSNFTLPLGGSKTWGLRFGVTNEYVSKPVDDTKRLDTTYYLRFVYNVH